eukprot:gene17371-19109_t
MEITDTLLTLESQTDFEDVSHYQDENEGLPEPDKGEDGGEAVLHGEEQELKGSNEDSEELSGHQEGALGEGINWNFNRIKVEIISL